MASKSQLTFDESAKDVERLMEIHKNLGGAKKGRRYKLEVLNKSAVVLITAIWHPALGPDHSMISSARASSDCGIESPSALAVLRLMTSSNLVGCSMGRSAGFAPFRILST